MKRFAIAGIAALSTLAAAPAFANPPGHANGHGNGRGASFCAPGHGNNCRGANPGHGQNDWRHGGRHAQHRDDHRDGRRGDSYRQTTQININIGYDARNAERWHYRDGYGIRPAPYGQEYRVINGQLVLVDSQTLQVVALVGLLSALLN